MVERTEVSRRVGVMGTPTLIIVSGPAGSGKTALAHTLAAAIGCPALSRDEIKEGMVASNPGFVASTSDALTRRTYDLFFATIRTFLEAEVTLVAEAAFQHALWWRGLEPLVGLASMRVVRCQVPASVARARQLARLTSESTRAAHAEPTISPGTRPSRLYDSTPPRSRSTPVMAGVRVWTGSPPSVAPDPLSRQTEVRRPVRCGRTARPGSARAYAHRTRSAGGARRPGR